MINCNPRSLTFALLIAALPVGFAFAGGSGGRGGVLGGGVGAAGMGSAAVGGGAGHVGGGAPAGEVGGGSPGSNNPAGNGAAGTGNPSVNSGVVGSSGNGTNAPGIPSARTTGGAIGGYGGDVGMAPMPGLPAPGGTFGTHAGGGASPAALSHELPSTTDATAPKAVLGVAEQGPFSPTGLARPGPDGVSTVIVAPRPCGVAAHETDGTTTCIGIPDRSPNLNRSHRRRAAADLP
jgi:hypothetical protein